MTRKKLLYIYISSLILFIVGFIGNIGLMRFIMSFVVGPFIVVHYTLHLILVLKKSLKAPKARLYSALSHIALVVGIIFLPDQISTGSSEQSAFLHLYKNPPDIIFHIAAFGFIAWMILSVMTIISWGKEGKTAPKPLSI